MFFFHGACTGHVEFKEDIKDKSNKVTSRGASGRRYRNDLKFGKFISTKWTILLTYPAWDNAKYYEY